MEKRKKIGSLLLCALLIVSISAGCTKNTNKTVESTKPDTTNVQQTTDVAKNDKLAFSYMMAGKWVNWMNDLAWYPELKKQANADIKLIDGGDDAQYFSNVDLKVGSGEFPDAGIVNGAQAEVYGAQGAFVDMKPLIDKFAPNIKSFLDANPDYKSLVTSKDGKIFGLAQNYPVISNLTLYREDMMKKAGVTTVPKTSKEFTDMLIKLRDHYKDVKNFYPFTGRGVYLKYAFSFNAQDIIDDKGKVHGIYKQGSGFDIHAPGYKTMIEWYKNLYDQKLIDPEWVTYTATEESWVMKMISGQGVVSDDFFTRPAFLTTGGGTKNNPDFSIKVMDPFADLNGKPSKRAVSYTRDQFLAINAKAKNAEDIIKFMNVVFGKEGQTLMQYGVEGKTHKVENGKNVFIADFAQEQVKPLGTLTYGVWQDRLTFPAPVNNEAYYESFDALTKSYAKDYFSKNTYSAPVIKYAKVQQVERTNLLAKVNTAVDAEIVKFITGKRAMSEFDSFLKEMDALGYTRIVEIDQAAKDTVVK